MTPDPPDIRALYLHVPFCSSKCDYCAFHSLTGRSPDAMRTIVRAILDDVDHLSATMPTIDTLYVGGGTPTVLDPEDLVALIDRPRLHGARPREITVEGNPESCTPQMLSALARAGVTRLSVGVQTLEPAAARGLGRRLTNVEEIGAIRSGWPGLLSADLIHGAPGATQRGFFETIRSLVKIGVDHVSVYGLGLEQGTPLARRVASGQTVVPDATGEWRAIVRLLEHSGYRRYEVSNFARPGAECLHNVIYWTVGHYLGLGPSAVSTFGLDGKVVRATQPVDHTAFLARRHPFDCEHETLGSEALRAEYAMLGLRRPEGISRARLLDALCEREASRCSDALASLEAQRLLVLESDHVRPTGRGMDLLNLILARLLD